MSDMNANTTFDLTTYFTRIGYDGPRAPTLEMLRAIQRLHPQAIAFENLNPLLGLPVRLDIESLQQKLVRSRRGGRWGSALPASPGGWCGTVPTPRRRRRAATWC
jgi:hypothetical protein